jgi:CRISPR-associated protein Cmr4
MTDTSTSTSALLFLYAQTPVHAGAQSNGPVIDLEIQRSVVTGIPQFNDSTVKGALKNHLGTSNSLSALAAFGSSPGDPETKPGWCAVTDAHLLALPMQSSHNTFAWVTSPRSLQTLNQIAAFCGMEQLVPVPEVFGGSALAGKGFTPPGNRVTLHDFDFKVVNEDEIVAEIAAWILANGAPKVVREVPHWQTRWTSNLLILSDDDFTNLSNIALDIRAHNAVADSNLFFAEDLPCDSLMVCALMDNGNSQSSPKQSEPSQLRQLCKEIEGKIIWLGGDQSNGHGALWATPFLPFESPKAPR